MTSRYERFHLLVAAAERNVDRPLKAAEMVRIHHALVESDAHITAKLALGAILGLNDDWPEAHIHEALKVYALEDLAP